MSSDDLEIVCEANCGSQDQERFLARKGLSSYTAAGGAV
jgi:hypothetical protein